MTPDPASSPTPASGADAIPGAAAPEPPALVPANACPFLIAAAGAYRMSIPDREHRCAAFVPATSLALSKQSRLCLTPNHPGCATYIASTSARQARTGVGERIERSGRWGFARTMPVVEEVGGLRATLSALMSDRRTWPAIPAVLLATLLLALGLSGSWSQGPVTALASLVPSPRSDETPRPSTAPSQEPSSRRPASEPPASEAPPSTPAPTTGPSATPVPAFTTYRVKSGDTLYVIAQTFKTTVSAIQRLNNLATTNLHVGQVLKIPRT